jgi:hypothetical protein
VYIYNILNDSINHGTPGSPMDQDPPGPRGPRDPRPNSGCRWPKPRRVPRGTDFPGPAARIYKGYIGDIYIYKGCIALWNILHQIWHVGFTECHKPPSLERFSGTHFWRYDTLWHWVYHIIWNILAYVMCSMCSQKFEMHISGKLANIWKINGIMWIHLWNSME